MKTIIVTIITLFLCSHAFAIDLDWTDQTAEDAQMTGEMANEIEEAVNSKQDEDIVDAGSLIDATTVDLAFQEIAQDIANIIAGGISADDTAYNATSWDDNLDPATKNAIRDKFEAIVLEVGAQINDSAGDGDTTETWSADKCFDEFALKQDYDENMILWPVDITAIEVGYLDDVDDSIFEQLNNKAPLTGGAIIGALSDYSVRGTSIAATAGVEGDRYEINSAGTTTTWATCGASAETQYTTFVYGSVSCVGDGTMYPMYNLVSNNETPDDEEIQSPTYDVVNDKITEAKFTSLKVSDLNDSTTPSVLTVAETTNTVISTSGVSADHVFTNVAPHINGNFILLQAEAYQTDLEPVSGDAFILNGTAAAANEHIVDDSDTLYNKMVCYCAYASSGDLEWICFSETFDEATP